MCACVLGFSLARLATQLIGVAAAFVWAFGASFLLFVAVHRLIGLRVASDDEGHGLDLVCHGAEGYPAE